MITIHELLLGKKRLWNWSNAVVNNDYWQEFVAYAKAHVLNTRNMSAEAQRGVIALCEAFEELTEPEPSETSNVEQNFGLNHSLDDIKKPGSTEPKPKDKE